MIHDLIYWTDINTINVLHIQRPNDYYTIINTTRIPQELKVNPMGNCLVWTYNGVKPRILSSFQDGSNQTVIYSTNKQPFHLTIDIHLKRYFFIDSEANLNSVNYQGGDEQRHFQSENLFHDIKSAVIYGDNIFLLTDSLFYSINKFGHNLTEHLISSKLSSKNKLMDRQLSDFKLMDPILQPDVENKCRSAKCSHLCLPSDKTQVFRCLCPENRYLFKHTLSVENSVIEQAELSVLNSYSLVPANTSFNLNKTCVENVTKDTNLMKNDSELQKNH